MMGRLDGELPLAEHAFFWKCWTDCWPNLAGLLGANLLFLLWCVPSLLAGFLHFEKLAVVLALVTVGPALVGLFRYAANLALERQASFWWDSLRGFCSGFRTGVLAAAVILVALTAHRLALTMAIAAGMSAGAVALWVGQLGILLVLTLTGAHTLSLVGLYQQGVLEAFRNALLLTFAHPMPAAGLVGAGILTMGAARALGGGPLVILPALLAVLTVNTTLLLVTRHHPVARDCPRPGRE